MADDAFNLGSTVWNYFDRRETTDNQIFGFCKVGNCKEKIGCPIGITSALFINLHSYHLTAFKECEQKREETKKVKKDKKNVSKKQQLIVTGLWDKKVAWPSTHLKAVQIMQAIGRILALNYLPYDSVEGRGLIELMSIVTPQYRIPS